MNIVILGPQGSGKGTQAELLSKALGLTEVEGGALVRNAAKTDKELEAIMNDQGKLIPDERMFQLVKDHVQKVDPQLKDILFDGYPRSISQYKLLSKWMAEKGQKIDKVILIDISETETINRLSARRICEKCGEVYNLNTNPPPEEGKCGECGGKLIQREDDKPEAIMRRLEEYRKQTLPLIEIFEERGLLIKVDGERPIEKIFEEIMARLKSI